VRYLNVGSAQCVTSLLFASVCHFLITRLMFLMFFSCLFLFCIFVLFCVFCVFVLFCVLFLLLCCLFPIFAQVYRPLPPDGNPIAVNKCHTISYHIISPPPPPPSSSSSQISDHRKSNKKLTSNLLTTGSVLLRSMNKYIRNVTRQNMFGNF
jgi:energy-coupling factor transporter transmembrane protein EcfT